MRRSWAPCGGGNFYCPVKEGRKVRWPGGEYEGGRKGSSERYIEKESDGGREGVSERVRVRG